MGDLSRNFSRAEFKCKCGKCDQVAPPHKLIELMQDVRDHFDATVTVHSGHRCKAYNASVGGVSNSQHILGTACDFTVKGVTNNDVQEYVLKKYKGSFGIGRYRNFTHIDVRPGMARWDNR